MRMVVAPSRGRQNAAKSCSPTSEAAAASMASTSSARGTTTRAAPLERVAGGGGVGDAVLVATPDRGEPRVEAVGGPLGVGDHDVGVGPDDAGEPPRQGGLGRRVGIATPPRSGHGREGRLADVEVGDLPERVHPGVRAPGDGEPRRLARAPEQRAERLLEHALHGAEARLPAPAVEVGAVVGDAEADAHDGCRGIRFDDVLVARVDRLAHDHQPTAGRPTAVPTTNGPGAVHRGRS